MWACRQHAYIENEIQLISIQTRVYGFLQIAQYLISLVLHFTSSRKLSLLPKAYLLCELEYCANLFNLRPIPLSLFSQATLRLVQCIKDSKFCVQQKINHIILQKSSIFLLHQQQLWSSSTCTIKFTIECIIFNFLSNILLYCGFILKPFILNVIYKNPSYWKHSLFHLMLCHQHFNLFVSFCSGVGCGWAHSPSKWVQELEENFSNGAVGGSKLYVLFM